VVVFQTAGLLTRRVIFPPSPENKTGDATRAASEMFIASLLPNVASSYSV
jgi:hypothetical protein